MRHNSSVLFWLKLYILSTKEAYESKNFCEILHEQSKFCTLMAPFVQIMYSFSQKSKEEFLMTVKSDEKFKEKLIVVSNMT